ncbi:5-bromo-4-chloroindolyl phosphate hydrolysis protein [Metabacillus crassostreae]|uniref:5-bromo-4-chloroindolyl phosphate hydrolysis family protein n=1 Tax=Metabacillus crassostreae TaxID=929098 RepID=UPI00195C6CC3|nr:5-bromo-4-chloroindolyl phosphate hydrolysis family protein [Metabacillus crassostreae]MBM7606360.1 5-bromo-4-chloroindolyl phosphate hydrolysis protein [Metabacillus crassostreae]
MKQTINFFIQSSAALFSTVAIWTIGYFPLDQSYLLASTYAIGGGTAVFFSAKAITFQQFLKQNQLTRKEYRYIKQNLKEANHKIKRLRKALFTIRNVASIKQNLEIYRVVSKIYSITKKEPKRFYLAEQFYYSHLDSIVELSEKYAFLASQPKKNNELTKSLNETRRTISDLEESLEKDLHDVVSKDINQLHFELDVAKLSLNKSIKNDK